MESKVAGGSNADDCEVDRIDLRLPETVSDSKCSAIFHYGESKECCISCFVLIDSVKVEDGKSVIKYLWTYPLEIKEVQEKYPNLNLFILSDVPQPAKAQKINYTSISTSDSGHRTYYHCVVFDNNQVAVSITKHPWCNFFYNLGGLFDMRTRHLGDRMLKTLFSCLTPPSGASFPTPPGTDLSFKRPYDRICPFIDTSPLDLLQTFPNLNVLFSIMSNLLLEKTTIIVGPNYPIVSKVLMSLQAFISPFEWVHIVLSPCLPELMNYLQAPVPILCSLQTWQLQLLDEEMIESCLMVELDENGVYKREKYFSQDPCLLPKSGKLSKFRTCLNLFRKRTPDNNVVCDLCRMLLSYYAEMYTSLMSEKFMKSEAAGYGLSKVNFYREMSGNSRLHHLTDEINKCLDSPDKCWLDNEFIVAVLRSDPSYSPKCYQELIEEEKKGGGFLERHKFYFEGSDGLKSRNGIAKGGYGGEKFKSRSMLSCFSCARRNSDED
ncbi:unnamed protein product [Phytomonas sp. EM1]|nr:unnamed protein product [Phytomonas sp. EM1]|eukprot:CCW62138.1 unnamed protein product [Phytomonas sp. isolate EM1]